MECPSCGADNKPDAVFCMSCGAPLPDVPFAQLKKEDATRQREGAAPGTGPVPGPPPASQQVEEPVPAPPPRAPATPEAPPAAGTRPLVEEPGGERKPPSTEPPPDARLREQEDAAAAPRPSMEPPAPAPAAHTQAAPTIPPPRAEPREQGSAPATPPPHTEPPTPAPGSEQPPAPPPAAHTQAAPPPKPEYYIPPEVDYDMASPPTRRPAASPPPAAHTQAAPPIPPPRAEPPAQSPAGLESTQEVAAIIAAGTAASRERKLICPECYAPNPEGNSFCQECGSALPVITGRKPEAAAAAPGRPAHEKTAVLAPATQEGAAGAAAQPAYPAQLPRARRAYGDKAFGVADILALFSVGAAAIAIALSYGLDSFSWKKGVDISMFSHQGAYSQGRTDLLGGPGLLPYEGAEFLTVGLVVAAGVALALVFLAVRTGRGPMFILSGCLLLLPAAYLLFQAILPLRQMGIQVDPSLGISGIFFGNAANPGVGPPLWLVTGAGALLVLAGFIAPPRGWGRLFTFLLCFSVAVGVAFFCAACFNWNLFISDTAAAARAAQPLRGALAYLPLLLL